MSTLNWTNQNLWSPLQKSYQYCATYLESSSQDELTEEDFREATLQLHHNLSRKAKAQALLMQHFWGPCKSEYLTLLMENHATGRTSTRETNKVGDVIIIHDDCPTLKWHLHPVVVVQKLQRKKII